MKKVLIKLPKVEDVTAFVQAAGNCEFDVDVIYNRVIVDAKSMLGVLSIASNPVYVTSQGNNAAFEGLCQKYSV